jgi:hypothetical protein
MIDALETALLDDLAEIREATIWPLARMRHERALSIPRHAYYLEQESTVKAQIVRVTNSLMVDNPASTDAQLAEKILQDVLQSTNGLAKQTTLETVESRQRMKPSGQAIEGIQKHPLIT